MPRDKTMTPGTAATNKHAGGRRKGTPGTRDAILKAAISQFAEHGFEGTTLRSITDLAGVDVAMVSHFFGNKQGLFDEAVLQRGTENVQRLISTPASGRPAVQLLDSFFAMWENADTATAVRALFRAALESEEHRRLLQDTITRRLEDVIHLLADRRDGIVPGVGIAAQDPEEAKLRTQLIAAHLLGIGIGRYIMKFEPIASTPCDELIERLAPVIEAYVPEMPTESEGRSGS